MTEKIEPLNLQKCEQWLSKMAVILPLVDQISDKMALLSQIVTLGRALSFQKHLLFIYQRVIQLEPLDLAKVSLQV